MNDDCVRPAAHFPTDRGLHGYRFAARHPTIRMFAAAMAITLIASPSWISAAGQAPSATPVRVGEVKVERVAQRRLVTGDLRAAKRSLISSREPGIVIEFPVEEGRHFEQGDLLARLDASRLELDRARLDADRMVALAARDEQAATLSKLRQQESRIRASFERGAGSQQELDDIEADLAIAHARVAAAERTIDVVDAQVAVLDRRIADMTITAPFPGYAVAKRTEIGQWLGAGDHVLEMLAVDHVEAWINVPQEHFATLSRGGYSIEFRVDAADASRRADSFRLLPQVDPRARSFTLIALLSNTERSLAPGMSVQAWVPMLEESERLTVPKAAVNRGETGNFVYVVRMAAEGGGGAQAVPVRVEPAFPLDDRFVVNASGLSGGDQVIIEGNERLFPFAAVRIVEQQARGVSGD